MKNILFSLRTVNSLKALRFVTVKPSQSTRNGNTDKPLGNDGEIKGVGRGVTASSSHSTIARGIDIRGIDILGGREGGREGEKEGERDRIITHTPFHWLPLVV